MKVHELKCWSAYFIAISEGRKRFEIRVNDRDFQEGDLLLLKEWDLAGEMLSERPRATYTGNEQLVRVLSVQRGERALAGMLAEDAVAMSIEPILIVPLRGKA